MWGDMNMFRISARLARELNESGWIDKFKNRSKGNALFGLFVRCC